MITFAFFVSGLVLMPALSTLNLWLVIKLGGVGLVVDILLCIAIAVVLTFATRKIQRCKGKSAVGLLMSFGLIPFLAAILLLIRAYNSSLQWLGIFLLALSLLITDILITGMTAFGIWDDTEGDKTKASDDNSDV